MAEMIDKWDVVNKLIRLENSYQFYKKKWDADVLYRRIRELEVGIGKTPGLEVVRCRECKHYEFGVCLKIYSDGAVSQYAWQARKEGDFCSYGERKDND